MDFARPGPDAGKSPLSTRSSSPHERRVVDLVPGARVMQAVDFVSDDPANAGTMTLTWEITPVG
jgi:hypothetical protein